MPLSRLTAAPITLLGAPVLLGLTACAAQRPPAASPEAPPPGFYASGPREPSPVDHEMLAIGKAEEEIDRLIPEARSPGSPASPRRAATPPPPPPRKAGEDVPRDAAKADPLGGATAADAESRAGGAGAGAAGDPCAVACNALSSMVRSAERLCQLSGENDGRCDDARARVRGASARVRSSCPRCSVSIAPAVSPKAKPSPEAPGGPAPGMPGSAPSTIP